MKADRPRNFQDLVGIYKATEFHKNSSEGTLIVSSPELCDCLEDILSNSRDYGITLESGDICIGSEITLHFEQPRLRIGQFHNLFADYLKNSKNRIKEADNLFICSDKIYNRDADTPLYIHKYRVLLRIIALFKECAAYLDEANCELVFVDSSVIKVPINYSIQEVTSFDYERGLKFLANFAENTHREQKLTILANSIRSMSETKTKETSFAYLINDFAQLTESFDKGYRVFVSGFSYDKILDQLRVAKIEEMGKIHKVFSDIQNQLLGIPVATIIVATQMKFTDKWDGQALINTAVVLGALFFTAMILFVGFNQWQTLTAINDELNYKKKQAENSYKFIYGDISSTFSSLKKRIIAQRIVFVVLALFVAVGAYITGKFYFFLTPHAYNYLFK